MVSPPRTFWQAFVPFSSTLHLNAEQLKSPPSFRFGLPAPSIACPPFPLSAPHFLPLLVPEQHHHCLAAPALATTLLPRWRRCCRAGKGASPAQAVTDAHLSLLINSGFLNRHADGGGAYTFAMPGSGSAVRSIREGRLEIIKASTSCCIACSIVFARW